MQSYRINECALLPLPLPLPLSSSTLQVHNSGALLVKPKNYKVKNSEWYCGTCDIYCNSKSQFEVHMVSTKHSLMEKKTSMDETMATLATASAALTLDAATSTPVKQQQQQQPPPKVVVESESSSGGGDGDDADSATNDLPPPPLDHHNNDKNNNKDDGGDGCGLRNDDHDHDVDDERSSGSGNSGCGNVIDENNNRLDLVVKKKIDFNNFDLAESYQINARSYLIPNEKRNGKFEKFGFYCRKCDSYMTGQLQLLMHVRGSRHQYYSPGELPGYQPSKVYNPNAAGGTSHRRNNRQQYQQSYFYQTNNGGAPSAGVTNSNAVAAAAELAAIAAAANRVYRMQHMQHQHQPFVTTQPPHNMLFHMPTSTTTTTQPQPQPHHTMFNNSYRHVPAYIESCNTNNSNSTNSSSSSPPDSGSGSGSGSTTSTSSASPSRSSSSAISAASASSSLKSSTSTTSLSTNQAIMMTQAAAAFFQQRRAIQKLMAFQQQQSLATAPLPQHPPLPPMIEYLLKCNNQQSQLHMQHSQPQPIAQDHMTMTTSSQQSSLSQAPMYQDASGTFYMPHHASYMSAQSPPTATVNTNPQSASTTTTSSDLGGDIGHMHSPPSPPSVQHTYIHPHSHLYHHHHTYANGNNSGLSTTQMLAPTSHSGAAVYRLHHELPQTPSTAVSASPPQHHHHHHHQQQQQQQQQQAGTFCYMDQMDQSQKVFADTAAVTTTTTTGTNLTDNTNNHHNHHHHLQNGQNGMFFKATVPATNSTAASAANSKLIAGSIMNADLQQHNQHHRGVTDQTLLPNSCEVCLNEYNQAAAAAQASMMFTQPMFPYLATTNSNSNTSSCYTNATTTTY